MLIHLQRLVIGFVAACVGTAIISVVILLAKAGSLGLVLLVMVICYILGAGLIKVIADQ